MRKPLIATQLKISNIHENEADVTLWVGITRNTTLKRVRSIITDVGGIEIHFGLTSHKEGEVRVSPQFRQEPIMDLEWEANRRTLRITELKDQG